ncbi:MAG: pyroglutamyl-peptidase I [Planctomycetota bacterium]|jgi:pyroglutamyl-peptidase
MKRTLLLTGFEPFGDWKTNPSFDALKLATKMNLFDAADANIEIAEVPVAYETAFDALDSLVREITPEAILHFGLHGGMQRGPDVIYIETTARNRNGANKADNSGVSRGAGPIIENAAAELPSGLPTKAMHDSLKAAGFNSELSDDAGGYLCNYLFYRSVHAYGQKINCGFVHVPPVDTQGGLISLDQMAQAVTKLASAAIEA